MFTNQLLTEALMAENANILPEDFPTGGENAEVKDERVMSLKEMLKGQAQIPSVVILGNEEAAKDEHSLMDWPMESIKKSTIQHYQKRSRGRTQSYRLEFPWTFWITDPSKEWDEAIERVYDFSTARDFWRLFNHLVPPSKHGHFSYNLFKKGIRPEWEDPENAGGGRWNLTSSLSGQYADAAWLELCMLCVGGSELESLSSAINGIYLTWKRNAARISVWMNTTEQETAMRVGETIQRELQDHMNWKYSFEFTEIKPARGRKTFLYAIN